MQNNDSQNMNINKTDEYGKGFSSKSLQKMFLLAAEVDDTKIIASLMRQLSWMHFTLQVPFNRQPKIFCNFYRRYIHE